MNTLVVNFLAGPGTGKSTVTAHTFAKLKWDGYNVEMALEYAKDKVWEQSTHVLANQEYIFAKQYKRINQLVGQVDIVLTDGPLVHTLVYNDDRYLNQLVLARHSQFNNLNIFLMRQKAYNPAGRSQTEDEARDIDHMTLRVLSENDIPYSSIYASESMIPTIVSDIKERHSELNDEAAS